MIIGNRRTSSYTDDTEIKRFYDEVVLVQNKTQLYTTFTSLIEQLADEKNKKPSGEWSAWDQTARICTLKDKIDLVVDILSKDLIEYSTLLSIMKKDADDLKVLYKNKKEEIDNLKTYTPTGYKKTLDSIERIFTMSKGD